MASACPFRFVGTRRCPLQYDDFRRCPSPAFSGGIDMSLLRNGLAILLAASAFTCAAQQPGGGQAVATFAGGCFWCMEPPYDALPGVISTTSGYMGGTKKNPSYEEVSSGTTGHAEVVQV